MTPGPGDFRLEDAWGCWPGSRLWQLIFQRTDWLPAMSSNCVFPHLTTSSWTGKKCRVESQPRDKIPLLPATTLFLKTNEMPPAHWMLFGISFTQRNVFFFFFSTDQTPKTEPQCKFLDACLTSLAQKQMKALSPLSRSSGRALKRQSTGDLWKLSQAAPFEGQKTSQYLHSSEMSSPECLVPECQFPTVILGKAEPTAEDCILWDNHSLPKGQQEQKH